MFGYISGLVGCARGRHERSEPRIRMVNGTYYSQCRYCRTPMRREAKRRWVVDSSAPKR